MGALIIRCIKEHGKCTTFLKGLPEIPSGKEVAWFVKMAREGWCDLRSLNEETKAAFPGAKEERKEA